MHRIAAIAALLALATPAAARGPDRSSTAPWFGVRLGALAAAGSVGAGTPSAVGGGGYVLFDGHEFLADFSLDIFAGSDARFIAAGLGAYYPFTPGNISPYVGGALKLGWTRFGGDGAFGLIPYAAVGLLAGRVWYPQLRIELGWFLNLSREERAGLVGDLGTRAHGPMLTVGLAF